MAVLDRPGPEPHAAPAAEVVARLGGDPARGLGAAEAARRLARHGPNALERPRRPAYARIALRQLADPLVGLLVAAAAVSAAIGETLEAGAIAAIVVLNAVVGFVQESGAERAVLALRASLSATATAVRDGAEAELPAEELVPGDLLRLREGDRVPADARVLETLGLEADESLLTGESVPVAKGAEAVPAGTPLAERASMVYAGTAITRGGASALVVATGRDTEGGAIAALADEAEAPRTPLQRRLGRLALWMVALGIGVTLALTAAMLARGEPLHDAFLVGVSVAVAAVPEGLAATLTIALALGAREMARRGAVVRRLSAIETIGEATVVCTDKTGTLTENRLRLERLATAAGVSEERLLEAARLASAGELDPVDRALVEAALAREAVGDAEVVRAVPFEAARKRATVVVRGPRGLGSVVKGAPEVVLARCAGDPGETRRLEALAEEWAAEGLRVLALAGRPVGDADGDVEALESALRPLGLVALADPLRPDAAESLAAARALGLEVRMLTGDHPLTAAAVGRALDLPPEAVHARVTPAGKLALVAALQRGGETVAVTGDGVNDAPALRQADVGVAMGRSGTEAAREASALVLTDDAFATIVAAVREGRRIAANVRSFLAFLLSANLGEVVLFAIAVAAGVGVPMTVVQVLVVNLLTDGPPAIALALDPAGARGETGPRRGSELLGRRLVAGLLVVGVAIGLAALAAYLVVRERRPEAAQTSAFATVALAELVFVSSCRSERVAAWRLPPNPHLRAAVAGSLALVAAAVYAPFLHEPLGTVSLTAAELGLVAGLAVLPTALAEAAKAAARNGASGAGARLTL